MSGNRRRQARVQGGWAAASAPSRKPATSEKSQPVASNPPAWTGKNIDGEAKQTFVFEEPTEEQKVT